MAEAKLTASTMAVFTVKGNTQAEANDIAKLLENFANQVPHDLLVKLSNKTKSNPSIIKDIFTSVALKTFIKFNL